MFKLLFDEKKNIPPEIMNTFFYHKGRENNIKKINYFLIIDHLDTQNKSVQMTVALS